MKAKKNIDEGMRTDGSRIIFSPHLFVILTAARKSRQVGQVLASHTELREKDRSFATYA